MKKHIILFLMAVALLFAGFPGTADAAKSITVNNLTCEFRTLTPKYIGCP